MSMRIVQICTLYDQIISPLDWIQYPAPAIQRHRFVCASDITSTGVWERTPCHVDWNPEDLYLLASSRSSKPSIVTVRLAHATDHLSYGIPRCVIFRLKDLNWIDLPIDDLTRVFQSKQAPIASQWLMGWLFKIIIRGTLVCGQLNCAHPGRMTKSSASVASGCLRGHRRRFCAPTKINIFLSSAAP